MAGLQAFWQAFPNSGCFRPRISKDSFGGFVGFQWVTRAKNSKCLLPNFFAAAASFWTHSRRHSAAFRRLAPPGVVQRRIESVYVAGGGGRVHRGASLPSERSMNLLALVPISGKQMSRAYPRRRRQTAHAAPGPSSGRRGGAFPPDLAFRPLCRMA